MSLSLIGLLFLSPSAHALELNKPLHPGKLDEAWQQFLANDIHSTPAIEFPHKRCFQQAARNHDLPLSLLLAVARGESDFNARAVSSADAVGLMQILWPLTARHLGITRRSDLFDPCINVDGGSRYLREMLSRYNGNLHRALAAYNYGPGRISVQGPEMPKGAQWYSGYIYRHLDHVLAGSPKAVKVRSFNTEQKLALITFHTQYRAKAFISKLGQRPSSLPDTVRLDWIRIGTRAFRVVLLYKSTDELVRARQWLSKAGFTG